MKVHVTSSDLPTYDPAEVDRARRSPACDLDSILDALGATTVWSGALFLTPDGGLIDGSEQRDGGTAYMRSLDHRYCSDDLILDDTTYGARGEALALWMRATGCVRLNVNGRHFAASVCTDFSREQRDAITSHLSSYEYDHVYLDVLTAGCAPVGSVELRKPKPYEIRRALRRLSGILSSHNL